MAFIARLRVLSGGKSIGFKLCVGHPWEFLGLCKAMAETGITPDFIVVDGIEGGTGAAPLEFADHIGMPMREGGFMFALGCIQSLSCHTDRCPTGVTTQDKSRSRALVVADKKERVRSYHRSMLHALAELTAAAGLDHPHEFRPEHFSRRISAHESMTFAEIYPALKPDELLSGARDEGWRKSWAMAPADSFAPAG